MVNEFFQDGVYTVWAENISELKPGDTIYLTTSDFMYDCMCGCFMNDIRGHADVDVVILSEDLSEYVPEKSSTGGAYAYAAARVLKILDDEKFDVFGEESKHDVQTTLI